MNEKISKLNKLISEYQDLIRQKNGIEKLESILLSDLSTGLNPIIDVEAQSISIPELIGVSPSQMLLDFTDDLQNYLGYIKSTNTKKINTLLSQIEFTTTDTIYPLKLCAETVSWRKTVEKLIDDMDFGYIINPVHMVDSLNHSEPLVTLSRMHEVLRDFVEKGTLDLVRYASCHKCNSNYHRYYEELPKEVNCVNCGEDIVNIEINYKKAFK